MKKCEACGKTFADDQQFCDVCGKELVTVAEEATEEAAKADAKEEAVAVKNSIVEKFKAMDKKTKMICGAVAAVVVLAIIILICGSGTPKTAAVHREQISITYSAEDGITYVYNGKNQVKKIGSDETRYSKVDSSADGTVFLVKSTEKESSSKGSYFILTIKGLTEIGEVADMSSPELSADGTVVTYFEEVKNGVGELYSYNVKSKKSKRVDKDVDTSSVVLSPDGKSIAYSIVDEDTKDTKAVCSKNGKDAETIAKNSFPVAVSNGAKLVYYVKVVDGNRVLYVLKGKDSTKLAELNTSTNLYLNAAYTEALFNDDGKTYVSLNGKEKKKVSNNAIGAITVPAKYSAYSMSVDYVTVTVYEMKTLKNTLANTGDAIYKITSKFETTKVLGLGDISTLTFSEDLKSCVYFKNGSLYRINNINKPDNKKKLGDMEDYSITSFVALLDLNNFYFISDGDLFYKKGTGKPKKIASDAKLVGADREAFGVYYYIDYDKEDANTLYFSKNGSKKKVAAKNVKSTTLANGSYRTFTVENKKDDSMVDLYTIKGTSKKKLLTR